LLSAAHFGQRLDSGLPHSAQNFLAPVLSIPHFEQRIVLYQSTIAPTGKPDESEREGTERIDDDQQIVRDALPEYWRRGLLSQISQF
jgi:hypothetical protein